MSAHGIGTDAVGVDEVALGGYDQGGPVSVVVADDHALMRSALAGCLRNDSRTRVVGEAGDGDQAVELVRSLRPDVALIDIRMPRVDGVEATRRIVAEPGLRTRVVVVTTFGIDEYIAAALRAGASGFLLKDATATEVVDSVLIVAAGEAVLAPSVTRRLIERFGPLLPVGGQPPSLGLTPRETGVLRLVALGHSNAEIGRELHLAPSSVKTHIGHLLAKLELPDRVHLVIHAYETGLVHPAVLLTASSPEVDERLPPSPLTS